MAKPLASVAICMFVLVWAGGCAAPQPVPFRLVDAESKTQLGTFFPENQRIEVTIGGHIYSGFYIVATGAAVSQTMPARRFFPRDTITTFSSNSARAHLAADNGKQLNCEFLFEGRRALGECRSPGGAVFQLIADGN